MKYSRLVLILMSFFCLIGCMNQYEKQVIGKYELYKYDSRKSLKIVDDFSKLDLKENKTFELNYSGKKISGNWNADDYGDWTLIKFEYQDKTIEAQVGQGEISFYSLDGFGIENLNDVKFTKL